MKLLKELSELARDHQTWIRIGLSSLPTLFSFLFKVQGNPDALYVVLYVSLFLFVLFISLYALWAKNIAPGIPTIDNPTPADISTDKYPALRPYMRGSLVILFGVTVLLIFVRPYNRTATRFIYGTPTPTPTSTLTPTQIPSRTPTATSTFTITPSATPTPKEQGIYYMIVLDASLRMLEAFETESKWDAAVRAVNAILEAREDGANYGLVVIGGSGSQDGANPCDQPSAVTVPFSSRGIVVDHIAQLQPSGGGSIFRAFNLAKDQFRTLPENTVHTLVFISGSSDACESRDEWRDLQRAFDFHGGIGIELYSEIMVLEQNEVILRSIEQQFDSLSADLNVQVSQTIFQSVQSNNTVINNISNYVDIAIASFPTGTPISTPSKTPTLLGVTIYTIPPGIGTPSFTPTLVPPTWTPSTTPSLAPSPLASATSTPYVELLSGNYLQSDIGCLVDITVQISGSPATGSFHVWNAGYGLDGDIYPSTILQVSNYGRYVVALGGQIPEYYWHKVWFEYNGTSSNVLNLICPDLIGFDPIPFFTPIAFSTPSSLTAVPQVTLDINASQSYTPTALSLSTTAPFSTNSPPALPNLDIQAIFSEIDKQLQETLKANIAYIAPELMKLDDSFTIELSLNPSLSQGELATSVAERGDLVTTTPKPGISITDVVGNLVTNTPESAQLVTSDGISADIVTSEVEITNRMKAVLTSNDPDAFIVQPLDIDAEQVISSTQTTTWHWSITAKKEGTKTLELILYRLVKLDGNDYWRAVETYRSDIVVKVTPIQRLKELDWKWIIGILVTLLLVPAFWRWYDARNKQNSTEEEPKASEKAKPSKKKKVSTKEIKEKEKTKPKSHIK